MSTMVKKEQQESVMAVDLQKNEDLAGELYKQAYLAAVGSDEGTAKIFRQDELIELGVVHTITDLLPLIQRLTNKHFLRNMTSGAVTQWGIRTREIAEKLQAVSQDEYMVYQNVENSGPSGTWSKRLRLNLGISNQAVNKALKQLEATDLIKQIKNIRNPAQKSYILKGLSPGEDIVGGTWHSEDGDLDMSLIGITADVIVQYVERKSWVKRQIKVARESSKSPPPSLTNGNSAEHGAGTKRPREGSEEPGKQARRKVNGHDVIETQTSHPPGYSGYPTAETVLEHIKQINFIKAPKVVTQDDVEKFLSVLVLDGRLEKVGAKGYRTVKGVKGANDPMGVNSGAAPGDDVPLNDDIENTGLMQVPCGRCPVFDLCEEGGPVNAMNCEYFDTWLKA